MNIYDTKVVVCANCKKQLGEVDFESIIIRPLCGHCANPRPEGDKILNTVGYYQNKFLKVAQAS